MKLLMTQGGSPWECVVMREVWGGLSFFLSGLRFDCYALMLRIDCRLIIVNSFPPCVTLPLVPARILFAASIAEKDKRFGVRCERLLDVS